jgi:hypothetical protein
MPRFSPHALTTLVKSFFIENMYEELFVQDKIDYSYDGLKLTVEKNREMQTKFDFQDAGDEEDPGKPF